MNDEAEVEDIPLIIPKKTDKIPLLLPPKEKKSPVVSSIASTQQQEPSSENGTTTTGEDIFGRKTGDVESATDRMLGDAELPAEQVDLIGRDKQEGYLQPDLQKVVGADVKPQGEYRQPEVGLSELPMIPLNTGTGFITQEGINKAKEFIEGQLLAVDATVKNPIQKVVTKSYLNAALGGLGGIEKVQKTPQVSEKEGVVSGALNLAAGLARTGFSAASLVSPQLQTFNAAIEGADEVLPSQVIPYLMSPFSSTLQRTGGVFRWGSRIFDIGDSEGTKSAAELADLVWNIVLFKSVEKGVSEGYKVLADKVRDNITLNDNEVQMLSDAINEASKEAFPIKRETLEKIPNDLPPEAKAEIAPLIERKQDAETQKILIQTDATKLDENFRPQVEEKIAEQEKIISDTNQEIKKIAEKKEEKTELVEVPVESEKKDLSAELLAEKTLSEKQQELINTLPKKKVNFRDIKGIGDLSVYLNNPEALNSPLLKSAKKIYEDIKAGKEIKDTPSVTENMELMDGQNRIAAQLAAGIEDVDVAVIGKDFYDKLNETQTAPKGGTDRVSGESGNSPQPALSETQQPEIISSQLKPETKNEIINQESKNPKTEEAQEVEQKPPSAIEGKIDKLNEIKDRIRLAKDKRNAIAEKRKNISIIKDAFQEAKEQAEADRELVGAYVDLAKYHIEKGVKTIEDFAKEIGEDISDVIRKGWDIATGKSDIDKEVPLPKDKSSEPTIVADNEKAILKHLVDSENISESARKRLEEEGLTYEPHSHEEARSFATEIVRAVGENTAVGYAESGRFAGDINSSIFAVAIDKVAAKESALREQGKTKEADALAEKWADFAVRYDAVARQGGRFSSQVYDFYKKSPLGIRIKEQKIREKAFDNWYKTKEEAFKEFFDALTRNEGFQDLVKAGAESFKVRAKRVADKIRKGKIDDDIMMAGVPFVKEVWNGAIEAAAKVIEAGGKTIDALNAALEHIKNSEWYKGLTPENQSKAEARFSEKFNESQKEKPERPLKKEDEDKIVARWSKKLKDLPEAKKEKFIRDIVRAAVEKGEISYKDFKRILAEATGMGKLTETEVRMIDKYVQAANEVTELGEKARETGSEADIKKFDEALKVAERTATDLANTLYQEPNLTTRFTSLLALNTLGFGTLIKNIGYNVAMQSLVRFPKSLIGTAVDYTAYAISLARNKIYGTPIVTPSTNVFLAQRGYFKNLGAGIREVAGKIRRGGTYKDYFQQGIQHPRLKPFQSGRELRSWWRGERLLTTKEVVDKAMQATVGVPAEIISRGLLTGDTPFRWAAEGAKASQLARLKFGVRSKRQVELFRRFPEQEAKKYYLEKGLSEEQAQAKAQDFKNQILEAGDDATLTMNNIGTDLANQMKQWLDHAASKNEFGDLANTVARIGGVLNVPYLKIPLNAAWLAMNIRNPVLPLLQSAAYGYRALRSGDPIQKARLGRKSRDWASVAALGMATNTVAAWMANNGIITAKKEDDKYLKEGKKESGATTEYDKQFSMNVNKLLRGGGETQDGDVSIDLSWFGAQGSVLNVAAQKHSIDTEAGKDPNNTVEALALDDIGFNLSQGGIDGFTDNVFGGTSSMINAYTKGGGFVNQLGLQYANMLMNVFEPAMIAQTSRYGFGRELDIRGDSFGDQLSKDLYQRSFGAIGKKPETKLGVFGEEQLREGNYFGRVLTGQLGLEVANTDKMGYPIYEEYNKTHNSDLLPPVTPKTITVDGKDMPLNYDQQRELTMLVGSSRIELTGAFINNQAAIYDAETNTNKYKSQMTQDEVVDALKTMYDKGRELGVEKFKLSHPEFKSKKDTKPSQSKSKLPKKIKK